MSGINNTAKRPVFLFALLFIYELSSHIIYQRNVGLPVNFIDAPSLHIDREDRQFVFGRTQVCIFRKRDGAAAKVPQLFVILICKLSERTLNMREDTRFHMYREVFHGRNE